MSDTVKAYIESISKHCYAQMTYYEFNNTTLDVTPPKYREGRLTALKYVSELTWFYLQEEQKLKNDFKQRLIQQMKLHSCLANNDYKQGLYDAINEILNIQ